MLLSIDTAICRVGDMHSESAEVRTVASSLLRRKAYCKVSAPYNPTLHTMHFTSLFLCSFPKGPRGAHTHTHTRTHTRTHTHTHRYINMGSVQATFGLQNEHDEVSIWKVYKYFRSGLACTIFPYP